MAVDFKSIIGYKTFDELRLTAFSRWQAAKTSITNLNVGGVFRTLIELACQGVADLHNLMLEVVPKGFLRYASGQWADLKAEERGIERKDDLKAEGLVIFGRSNAAGNKVIQAGTIVKTDLTSTGEELRFFVQTDSICLDGIAELAVPVIAEFTGVKYNVGQSAIKNMVTHVAGFDYVTNAADWLTKEGTDTEDDESLLERCRLRWYELAVGSPALAYASWAMAIPGVVDVNVADQHPRGPGTVDVIILSTSGLPTPELVAQVQEAINAKRPTSADVLVRAPLEAIIDIEILIELRPEATVDPATIQSQAENVVNAWFGAGTVSGVSQLVIAKDFIRLDLQSQIRAISPDAIKNVKMVTPADDVAVSTARIATLGSLNVTVERAAED